MSLRIGDEAPDFTAETTQGPIKFHDWIGNGWAILFSHPKDYTPVCTTELGYMARIKGEFDKRNTKIIGLSADPVDDHKGWSKDIEETQGTAPNYPMIGDPDLNVAKLYDMIHPNATGGKHVVELRDLEVVVADDRVVGPRALGFLDVVRPALVVAGRVDGEADDLRVPLVELRLDARHVAELGRADGGEVLGMGEQDRPPVADPLVEVDGALGGIRREVRCLVSNA